MVALSLYLAPLSSSTSVHLKPPRHASCLSFFASCSKLRFLTYPISNPYKRQRKIKRGTCRADFLDDLPVGAALGACVLSSLLLPVVKRDDDEAESSAIDSTDTRFAAMGVISFIPYFNWLCWVFAWLDTGKRRYAVYSLAYLIPYIRSNLSINPEESWLPITSIVLCIIHVQLETSLRNGDVQGFQFFNKDAENHSSMKKKETGFDARHKKTEFEDKQKHMGPTRGDRRLGNEIPTWRAAKRPEERHEQENGDRRDDNERKEQ